MRSTFLTIILVGACALTSCKTPNNGNETPTPDPPKPAADTLTDEQLLDKVQQECLNYMWDGAEPNSGLAYERIHVDGNMGGNDPNIITTGGSGFGVAGIIVAMDRGFITRAEGVARLKKIVNFLAKADRFHGVWSHWMNPSGRVVPFGQKDNGGDIVESSFLMEGLLCARQYLDPNVESEKAVIDGINELWRGMEFDWYRRDGQNVIYWHWSPNYGWEMNFPLEGYNECMIVYILAASSPTHSCPAECYHEGWARSGGIRTAAEVQGYTLQLKHNGAEYTGGPLFWAHYSWFGMCPKGLKDRYADYWTAMTSHVMSDYVYCVKNPKGYPNYSKECWGLTASYSPDGYSAHAPGNDLGVITPTAALSSFPYSPKQSMVALKYFYGRKNQLWDEYGPIDAFSDTRKWYPKWYLAIDQLTIAPMIENYRSGLLWRLFMSCPEIQEGLKVLDITYTPEN